MEQLKFVDSCVELKLPGASSRKLATSDVIGAIQSEGVKGLTEEPLRECVRWRVECNSWLVYILELKPALRWIRWIDPSSPIPFGTEATYRDFRLATPYVILKVPFQQGKVASRCEVFYRNEPIVDLDSELFWCNLLNVSPNAYGCTAWFCTQYLGTQLEKASRRRAKPRTESQQLDAVLAHLWGGGFNRSSEHHEGKSCFSKAAEDKLDARVRDVEGWQRASVEDPNFVLKVRWKPTGLTVRKLISSQLASFQLPRDLAETGELINVLLGKSGSASKRRSQILP